MVVTNGGIYHNLKESRYVVTCNEGLIAYFFSSRLYMQKFLANYENERQKRKEKLRKIFGDHNIPFDFLLDLCYYREVEKRGFRILYKGEETEWQRLETLNYHLMKRRYLPSYHETLRTKLREWKKITVQN